MKHFLFSFLFVCLFVSKSFSQKVSVAVKYTVSPDVADKSLIFYDTNRKLTWNDFKATPDEAMAAAALTSAGFGYNSAFETSGNGYILDITVYCEFNKNESWVKPVGRNDYILNHEQHHFDISYICTLLFIKKLRAAKFTLSNYNKIISNAYKETAEQMSSLQNQYDMETHNGLLKDKQQEWIERIDKQLQALDAAEQ